jgi:hypothetical protein
MIVPVNEPGAHALKQYGNLAQIIPVLLCALKVLMCVQVALLKSDNAHFEAGGALWQDGIAHR